MSPLRVLRVLIALALGCGLLVAAPAAAWDAHYGRAWRADGVLHHGCHRYGFHYHARPRHEEWILELFLRGPGDNGLGTVAKDSDVDRSRGRGRFRVCEYSTRPGRFRIRGKLTIYHDGGPPLLGGSPEKTVKWIKPARFHLRRAG